MLQLGTYQVRYVLFTKYLVPDNNIPGSKMYEVADVECICIQQCGPPNKKCEIKKSRLVFC